MAHEVAYVTHVVANDSATITAPATVNPGDILVLLDWVESPDAENVVPTGFTQIGASVGTNNMKLAASYKLCDGSEDSATLTGMASAADPDRLTKILIQYRSDDQITAFSVSTPVVSSSQTGDPTQATLGASSGTEPVVGITSFGTRDNGASVDPRTTSITPDQEIGGGSGAFYVHTYSQNASAADYTWDMDDEGSDNHLWGFYLHNFTFADTSNVGDANIDFGAAAGGVSTVAADGSANLSIIAEAVGQEIAGAGAGSAVIEFVADGVGTTSEVFFDSVGAAAIDFSASGVGVFRRRPSTLVHTSITSKRAFTEAV